MLLLVLVGSLAGVASGTPRCCPRSMAYLPKPTHVCIDRFEASVVDLRTALPASPNYNPNHTEALWQFRRFVNMTVAAHPMPPRMAEFTRGARFQPRAMSDANATPQAYVDRVNADWACRNAGKRLCRHSEWKTACRGPQNTTYPYGDRYEPGRCNDGVPYWPPGMIGRSNNWQMLDPRIAVLTYPNSSVPLRRPTGAFTRCTNAFGVFDQVGNMDEIVADEPRPGFMTFVGGFYARNGADGASLTCENAITGHAVWYNDYSIGFRCCREPTAMCDA